MCNNFPHRTRLILLSGVAAMLLGLAGCGGPDESGPPSDTVKGAQDAGKAMSQPSTNSAKPK